MNISKTLSFVVLLLFSIHGNYVAANTEYEKIEILIEKQVGLPTVIFNHYVSKMNLIDEAVEYRRVSYIVKKQNAENYFFLYVPTAICGMSCLYSVYKEVQGNNYCFIGFKNENDNLINAECNSLRPESARP